MNTVRKLLLGASAAAALAGLATAANAQATSNATASVSATIIQPITITKDADLAFGTVARPATAAGSPSVVELLTGSDALQVNSGSAVAIAGTPTRGVFTVRGDAGRTFSLTGNTGTITLNRTGGGGTLTFTKNVVQDGTANTLSGTAGSFAEGTKTIYAGGTFELTNTTVTGEYTGNLVLTVQYN